MLVQRLTQKSSLHLSWPARSPDLAVIEHVWDFLGRNNGGHHDVGAHP